jgi:helicase
MAVVDGPPASVERVFLHAESADRIRVITDPPWGEHLRVELQMTDAGPRPRRLTQTVGSEQTPLRPEAFIPLLRAAATIRISDHSPVAAREHLAVLLSDFQLAGAVVRTCRLCALDWRYQPVTTETGIDHDGELICRSCAMAEVRRYLRMSRVQLSAAAIDRLDGLLAQTGELAQIKRMLEGGLDPAITRVDTIDADPPTTDGMSVDALPLDERLKARLSDRIDQLLPVQSAAVEAGLFDGENLLVVSATATGKTLIGELAGVDRAVRGGGALLFLVPLVALANQKYRDFQRRYGDLLQVSLRVGGSRLHQDGPTFDPDADIIVGTYEGVDHALRTGRRMGDVGTVVIDEVHELGDPERGPELDGLIARLRYAQQRQVGSEPQGIYLSATVGNPEALARGVDARVVRHDTRPVPIERHVTFSAGDRKHAVIDRLVTRAFDQRSSKGYRGQSIIFTNARARCHTLANRLDSDAAAYHAGLSNARRRRVESRFAEGELAAVVTTAALAAGVDFPAQQVIFDALAMGIEWLDVAAFEQMLGRAGRPTYHDRGRVYLIIEPEGRYHGTMERTEDAVAFELLSGEMGDALPQPDREQAAAQVLANLVVGGSDARRITQQMVADVDVRETIADLLRWGMIEGTAATPLGETTTAHFLSPKRAIRLRDAAAAGVSPAQLLYTDFETEK